MASSEPAGCVDWADYVAGFHADRPGITEQVLRRARHGVADPYSWLLAGIPAHGFDHCPTHGLVLDLACGSAPLWPRLGGRAYLGVDTSAAELAAARTRGAGPLVRAQAAALPLACSPPGAVGAVGVVVCSMALQVLAPVQDVLAEIGRVLLPGGRLVATVPARKPLRAADLAVLTGLLAALGRGLGYPNDDALCRLPDLLARAGLRAVSDERRRFVYPLRSPADADEFLASLYLPGLATSRYQAAHRWLRALARARVSLPVPIRRVIAIRG